MVSSVVRKHNKKHKVTQYDVFHLIRNSVAVLFKTRAKTANMNANN